MSRFDEMDDKELQLFYLRWCYENSKPVIGWDLRAFKKAQGKWPWEEDTE